jgi:hypothetical protein
MTKPKKWYLEESSGKLVLKDLNCPIKQPNAANTLGSVKTPPEEYLGKNTANEAILVSY